MFTAGSSGRRRMTRAAMPGRCAWRGATTRSSSASTPSQTSPATRRALRAAAAASNSSSIPTDRPPLPWCCSLPTCVWLATFWTACCCCCRRAHADRRVLLLSAGGQGRHALAHREGGSSPARGTSAAARAAAASRAALATFEVPFGYEEAGEKKHALVKVEPLAPLGFPRCCCSAQCVRHATLPGAWMGI